jgi:hypothetical protein
MTSARALLWTLGAGVLHACVAEGAPSEATERAAQLCAGRPGCALAESWSAGSDPDGQPLSVLKLALPEGSPGPSGAAQPCAPEELWLVRGDMPPLQLLHLCNDGYGASGVGEDAVSVGANRLTHSRTGGSAWRWSETRVWQLAPLELVRTEQQSFHAAAPDRTSTTTHDRRAGLRRTVWSTPDCGGAERAFDTVPDSGAAVVPPTVALDTCAAQADSAGTRGFVVHGTPGAAADARLWATLSGGRTLTVDLEDDLLVTRPQPGQSWLATDHLELWLDAEPADRSMQWECDATVPTQWAISLDAAVRLARPGAVEGAVQARLVSPGPAGRTRLELALPEGVSALTVVYSDTDDGAGQERLIATSRLRHGDGTTLGAAGPLIDQACRDIGGRWTVVDRWSPAF